MTQRKNTANRHCAYLELDYPYSFLNQWNSFGDLPIHPKFDPDSFSQEEKQRLDQYIDSMPDKISKMYRSHIIDKLSYKQLSEHYGVSDYMARKHVASAFRRLLSVIRKNRELFPSLHWVYDYIYSYSFKEGIEPCLKKGRVHSVWNTNEPDTQYMQVLVDDTYKKVFFSYVGHCIDDIVYLPDENKNLAVSIYRDYIRNQITEMEALLPILYQKVEAADIYLSKHNCPEI